MDELKIYKMELTANEFSTLKEMAKFAITQKEIYLTCLIKSEYGQNEYEIHKTAAELVNYKMFEDANLKSPF